ncbi:hemolysin III family protein [Kribbella sp. NPDC049174]|uniref:hemolysin III family protein n=1 Tax=Kribbella sp. NPDC049174 TaxID=3364112 RepID=UPI003720FEF3
MASSLRFGVSTLYHRGHWSPPATALLRCRDHSNIFLMIAGTYTVRCLGAHRSRPRGPAHRGL